jgi:O-antigen biosynthesis protein
VAGGLVAASSGEIENLHKVRVSAGGDTVALVRIDGRRLVEVLGDDLPYEDGAEAEILQVLEAVGDRSSTSDELASHIVDWPTRYHFSRLRANLLTPFRFGSSQRILEIGCGTGANLVTLAETGAEVVGVEGSLSRARAARVRTLSHDNVTVFAGDVALLPRSEPFDVVLLIGVLEYSTSAAGGASGPIAMLEAARSVLATDGVLVLAIENQVGLKYLLSHPEDHLGLPWVGLEGYPDEMLPRTWSRPVLAAMLAQTGFIDQEWLYPFPDYKLPTFLARDRLFRSHSGRQVLKQFVRQPVAEHAGTARLVCDSVRAFEVMIDAELGPDTANSFLVVASPNQGTATELLHDVDAWVSSGERLQRFRSQRTIRADANSYLLEATSGPTGAEPGENSWLRNVGHESQVIHLGDCLEDRVIAAVRSDDMDQLASALRLFDEFLVVSRVPSAGHPSQPFAGTATSYSLPGDFLDCSFKNLIVDGEGRVLFVDREWSLLGTLDEELIRVRAYFELALRIARSGTRNRWNPLMTIADLVVTLRQTVDDGWSAELVQRFADAEEELQRLVAGGKSQADGTVAGALRARLHEAIPSFPTLSLIRQAQEAETLRGAHQTLQQEFHSLQHEHQLLQADRQAVQQDREHIDEQLGLAQGRCHELEATVARIGSQYDEARRLLDDAVAARQHSVAEVESLRNSRAYRFGRTLSAPLRLFR